MNERAPAALAILVLAAALLSSPASAGGDGAVSPEELLPAGGAIEGWTPDGELLEYGPDDLWEYIDGSAETFLMYDFVKVAAMHYLDSKEDEVKVEIYRHGSPLMAFGIYSQFRSPQADYFDIGNEAFGDEYSLHFWKGDYYVKVDSYSEAPDMGEVMKKFAAFVAGAIPGGSAEPGEIGLLPAGGLDSKGVVYMTQGVMGSGKLPPAFMAPYERDGHSGKVYLFALKGNDEAAALAAEYAEGIGAQLTKESVSGASFDRAAGEAPYRGRVVALRVARWMAVVTGFKDSPATADQLALEIASALAAAE